MGDWTELIQIRAEIDDIDEEIIVLLKKRLSLAARIGKLKKGMNKSVIDREREKDLNAKIKAICRKYSLDSQFVMNIWEKILAESYRIQHDAK